MRAQPNFGNFYNLVSERTWVWDWLREGKLSPQQEATIMVVQNRALKTRYYERHVLKTRDNDAYRLCGKGAETVLHILNLCEKHQFTLMQERHDDCLRLMFPKQIPWA